MGVFSSGVAGKATIMSSQNSERGRSGEYRRVRV